MRIWISVLILATAAAGCGSGPSPQSNAKDDKAPAPTVFDDTVKTIDKAKASQALQENRVNDLNRQLDAEEQGDASGATPPADPNAAPNTDQQSK